MSFCGSRITVHSLDVAYCFRVFPGTPLSELRTQIRELLGASPTAALRFCDADGTPVFLSSEAPDKTEVFLVDPEKPPSKPQVSVPLAPESRALAQTSDYGDDGTLDIPFEEMVEMEFPMDDEVAGQFPTTTVSTDDAPGLTTECLPTQVQRGFALFFPLGIPRGASAGVVEYASDHLFLADLAPFVTKEPEPVLLHLMLDALRQEYVLYRPTRRPPSLFVATLDDSVYCEEMEEDEADTYRPVVGQLGFDLEYKTGSKVVYREHATRVGGLPAKLSVSVRKAECRLFDIHFNEWLYFSSVPLQKRPSLEKLDGPAPPRKRVRARKPNSFGENKRSKA